MPPSPLKADQLYRPCSLKGLDFKTTADLECLDDVIGQDRAVEAIRFAIGMEHTGYNLFAFGPEGTGKKSLISRFLEEESRTRAVPTDWCYVNNFEDTHKPRALQLPAGKACPLRDDMEKLVEELVVAIPATFEGDDYRDRRGALEEELKTRHEKAFSALSERAEQNQVAMVRTPMGLALAPVRDGEVLGPDDFEKLPEDERAQRKQAIDSLQEELEDIIQKIPKWEKEHRARIKELNREVTQHAVGHLIDELEKNWEDLENVLAYLEAVRKDVVEQAADFLPQDGGKPEGSVSFPERRHAGSTGSFRRYQVNVVVDHSKTIAKSEGAPLLYEDHPTQPNLVGRIEHLSQMGTLVTDFNLIKGGALHRANGGYLMIDVRKLLMQPYAWETLKRALQSKSIRIESMAESLGWVSTASLEPEAIPLNLKVVLIGEPMLYYLLGHYDPDFRELFKVAADFANSMHRDDEALRQYARLIATQVEREDLRALDRTAVARIVEHGSRLADDAERLTTHMGTIVDLVREADYFAKQDGEDVVAKEHVQQAIDAKVYRSDRIRERLQEEILRGTFVIDTDGETVGQINGLSVLQLDGFSFGRPSRITCSIHMGKGEVLDIERQVDLGGPLHSKGVLILESFLSGRFGKMTPIALSARLTFEQSYGGVDGDSASSAELYALLSAIAEVPIKQALAVTGSVDQKGTVQAIGGVNEKIEGYFDICKARGLDGSHGVLIPATNVKHLMLRADVVEAVEKGDFAIYPVETIDQGIELLTGLPAGEADAKGEYPVGSINRAVARKLARLAAQVKALSGGAPSQSVIKVQTVGPREGSRG